MSDEIRLDTDNAKGLDPDTTSGESAATKVLAITATAAFADACELAAIAEQEHREAALALESLVQAPSTTAMLTEATRSGVTQELPYRAEAEARMAAEAAAAGGDDPDAGASRGPRRLPISRRHLAVAGACLAVLAVIAVGAVWFANSSFAQPDAAAVEQVLAEDPDIMDGFASNDYVDESPYELSDVVLNSCEADDDGSYIVDASATISNESFESEFTVALKFARASEKDRYSELAHAQATSTGWAGAVLQTNDTTEAIAGVTRDSAFPDGFDATFDRAAQTCTYTAQDVYDFWFGTNTVSTPYTYSFNGDAWTRAQGEATSTVAYDADALQGSYVASDGDAANMVGFKIDHVDIEQGTFTVEYRAVTPGFASAEITGIIDCTLTRMTPDGAWRGYRQTDGMTYVFSGDGSSSGGEGTAHLEGALGLDKSIIFSFTGDYTRAPLLFGQPTDESMELAGTLVRE